MFYYPISGQNRKLYSERFRTFRDLWQQRLTRPFQADYFSYLYHHLAWRFGDEETHPFAVNIQDWGVTEKTQVPSAQTGCLIETPDLFVYLIQSAT